MEVHNILDEFDGLSVSPLKSLLSLSAYFATLYCFISMTTDFSSEATL